MTLGEIRRIAKLLDDAAVLIDHRQQYVSDETGEYLQCSCGLRHYLDDDDDEGGA